MSTRDVALVVLGAALGALAGLLLPRRDTVTVMEPASEAEALREKVHDLERMLAERPPPFLARPSPTPAVATAADDDAARPTDAAGRKPDAETGKAVEGLVTTSDGFGVFARAGETAPFVVRWKPLPDMGPPPPSEDVRAWLEGNDPAEWSKALNALARWPDPSLLPALVESINRPERRSIVRETVSAIVAAKAPAWAAKHAAGPPDTPIDGDLGTAWASKQQDMGLVTLDLQYAQSVRVDGVRVRETLAPGAIARIEAKALDGTWEVIWTGTAPRAESPAWFEPAVATTRYATNEIRLVIDTDRVPGWNEIDAVELIGDGLRQWASFAKASSSYAD